ncbi:hypothetical protein ID866_10609 [Astraeus odoratus]|nr:hypothetical protein ID866_10609 [Astraeus odoratus]
MRRNVQSIKQVHGLVQGLQKLAKEAGHSQPLMIGIDQENGLAAAYTAGTQFPGAMALAATGSLKIAEECSTASAKEMKLSGINWAYSPVADVNSDPRNPVIGVRSFGDDPSEVAKYASAVSRGLMLGGVASCAKHFPGHGDTHVDSHLALPVINKTEDDIMQTELVPFYALLQAGIPTVMTGHMALPLITGDNTPCSLSKVITTDLLRDKMGFDGVVVTDCLEMNAIAAEYTSQNGAVMALQAGADIAMICHTMELQRGAIERTYVAVENGSLSLETLRRSGKRIAALKLAYAGMWDEILGPFQEKTAQDLLTRNVKLSSESYAASIALIHSPLPIIATETGPVAILTPVMVSLNKVVDESMPAIATQGLNTGQSYLAFAESVGRRRLSQHLVYSPPVAQGRCFDELPAVLQTVAAIIFVTRSADRSSWQLAYLRKLLAEVPSTTPVLVLASCTPYDLMGAPDIQVPYLASFEYTPAAMEAAAAVIFGEREAKGRSPVRLRK